MVSDYEQRLFEKDCQDRETQNQMSMKYKQFTAVRSELEACRQLVKEKEATIQQLSSEIQQETKQHLEHLDSIKEIHLQNLKQKEFQHKEVHK